MKPGRGARKPSRPPSRAPVPKPGRTLTIVAQDPTVRVAGRILTAEVTIPNEALSAGPRGYRVHVVDYDATNNRMYVPIDPATMGTVRDPKDPFAPDPRRRQSASAFNEPLLSDPRFHAQNAYAIVMRTLAHFERALGRRASWSFGGHQIKVAPHAFAEANAFYSSEQEALLFGYFASTRGTPILNCLSHDIVAHETAHALVDGLRPRYMEPSSPDQAAFHEGFADVVALLSVFSIPELVTYVVRRAVVQEGGSIVQLADLTIGALQDGVLLGLGEQFGEGMTGVHGDSLRRSVTITPSPRLKDTAEYLEEHRRGELLVAAMLRAFLAAYTTRLTSLGRDTSGRLPVARVSEEGADIADRMLTMAIRALDYMPPTDISFEDYLSALITSDLEIKPDDSRYGLRTHLRDAFAAFGFSPASSWGAELGRWEPPPGELDYSFVHRDAMQRDPDEVFRFLWDNRSTLGLCDQAYTTVGGVRPCLRIDEDGFTLRETVADYVQILTVRADELETISIPGTRARIKRPEGLQDWWNVRLLGGGALLFDEFGQLKYHIRNALLNPQRQSRRLKHLADSGFFETRRPEARGFSTLHMKGMRPEQPAVKREARPWP
jgi:hypothetical protein